MEQPVDNIHLYNDWGDYVSEDEEDDVAGFTEGFDAYIVSGGYPGPPCYPVTVGELLQGGDGKAYRIEHKLGHGGFSTIWLAFEAETNTSVALKIYHLNERNVMLGLIPGALDQGPTPSERYKQVGRPQKFPLAPCQYIGRPGDLVAPIRWLSSMVAKTAFLGDFGLTKRADSPTTDNYLPPRPCIPPELFHIGFEPSYESDIWSFICIFTTLMTGFSPFDGWNDTGTLGCMVDLLGPLPRDWEGRYKWPHHYSYEERCKWYDQSRRPEDPLESFVHGCNGIPAGSRKERQLILEVLQKGFRYEPSQRISAQQLLNDASFRELLSINGIE
ncbi:hypothetical protein VMCG_09214 [Cytospora schulzeri]|uniref:Protein kinase domain-containing protein n=1 Tax=Cytospora schulzeri TaxID=448051 RepID=A0A423VLH0_9PEZI|nr:hypothetical protein VMCG_09214 [Valsa malicola]